MKSSGRIRGAVSPGILEKATRLFRNDDTGVWAEVLQNARRAGATHVTVGIERIGTGCRITVEDNGAGIEDFQSLLTLGASNWDSEVTETEDPAGMGFFSLCHSSVEVHSGDRSVVLTPATFLGREDADVVGGQEYISGTRLHFTRTSDERSLVVALERVACFAPLSVVVNDRTIDRHDFLEGALHREEIDGIEIGIATEFRWRHGYDDENWNFHGLRLRHSFRCPNGLFGRNAFGDWENRPLHIRFDVHQTRAVSLQLPDRRAIVENESFRAFGQKVRTALYRFFGEQEHHILSYADWKEARKLGVVLQEAAPLLRTWRAHSADDAYDSVFGESSRRLVADLSNVLLVSADLENPHTFNGSLATGATLNLDLFEEERAFEGYAWYSSLPRVASADVRIDGWEASKVVWEKERPRKIDVEVMILRAGEPERRVVLPAFIHVDSESFDSARFVAVSPSPWDDPGVNEPFSVVDFLMTATFVAADTLGEVDSWETQQNECQETVERIVQEYFLGPKASLLYILQRAIPWPAQEYLETLGINEFRFRRAPGRHNWAIDLGRADSAGCEVCGVADVSTAYLQESDRRLLLERKCPARFAITDDRGGTFHVVTQEPGEFQEEMEHASAFGLSNRFRLIMERLHAAGVLYVRFDADGGEIEGMAQIADA